MGPGYPDPMPAGTADPGAQCAVEQHMAPGTWNVKQGALARMAYWSSGREGPRYRFNLSVMDLMAEGGLRKQVDRLPRRSARNLRADQQ